MWVGKLGFFDIFIILRFKILFLVFCSKLINFVVNKLRDFLCLFGVFGELKFVMIVELYVVERLCVDVIG